MKRLPNKFYKELEKVKDLHFSNPKFAKFLSKWDMPFTTREFKKIMSK